MGDLAATLRSVQRILVVVAVPLVGCFVWTAAAESFQLPKMTVLALLAVALLGLTGAVALWERRIEVAHDASTWLALAFAGAAVLATVTSSLPRTSLVGEYGNSAGLLSYGSYVVLFLLAATLLRSSLVAFLRSLLVGVAVVAAIGIAQTLGLNPIGEAGNDVKIFTTLGNSNFTAGWLGALLPVSLWAVLDLRNSPRWRVLGAVAGAAAVVTLVSSRSFQGPLVATVGIGAFLAIRSFGGTGGRPLRRRDSLIAAAAVAAAIVLLLTPFVRDELSAGLLERRYMWRAALRVIADHPVLGTGLDTYANQFFGVRQAEHGALFGLVNPQAPHNVPLSLGSGGGLVLLGAYLGFVVAVAIAAVRAVRRASDQERLVVAALVAAWLGYQVQSLVSLDTPALGTLHWVLAGAVVAASAPRLRSWRLPGAPVTTNRRGRSNPAPAGTLVGIALIGLVALAGVVVITQPLRADLAFRDASRTGNVGEARERLERARSLAPWESVYALAQSSLEENFGSPIIAYELAVEAARLDPGAAGDARRAALLAEKLQRNEAAAHWWDVAIGRDPRNPLLLMEEAEFYSRTGDHETAVDIFERALDRGASVLPPEQAESLRNRIEDEREKVRARP